MPDGSGEDGLHLQLFDEKRFCGAVGQYFYLITQGAQFSCNANSTDCKFNFNYTASHHQSLLVRHWQDKGTGAGTSLVERFHGDIADA